MGEADGDVEHAHALVVELDPLPLAVRGRAATQVDVDVEDPPARAAHELGDAGADVEVHPPHDAFARTGVVVLDELLPRGNARLGVPLAAVGLAEEAALVGEDRRLEDRQAGEAGGDRLHGREGYRQSRDESCQSGGGG